MKTFTLASLLPLVSAHAIFQRVSVDGADQGLLNGVRSPNSNNPVQDVNSGDIACNTGFRTPVSTTVITIPAGARVGAQYQHIIGGPQGSNDADNPIAASHKGPVTAYLAKVSNAGTASTSGNKWFKVAEEGLNNGKWGVDTVLANNGWWYFTLPTCIAPGDYLMRIEILALHSAYTQGQAQFYPACANIRVTGSGSYTPSNTVTFPGAYSATDQGILINIYSGSVPNNGGRPYPVPGPAPITCPAGGGSPATSNPATGNPATSTTLVRTTTRAAVTTSGGSSGGSGAPLYGQCGGTGWTGPTTCASGTCKVSSEWYSQCL